MITELTILSARRGPVLGRHPWVFSGAFKKIPDGIKTGTPVRLVDEANNFLANGYFNSYSQIAVRLWSWTDGEEINEDFFVRRLKSAYDLRQKFVLNKKTNACRVFYSENDLLPGLVVDKYGDYLVTQFHNRGIAEWKTEIVTALVKIFKPKGIFERSDVGNRLKEMITPPFQEGARPVRHGFAVGVPGGGGLPVASFSATPPASSYLPAFGGERGGGVGILYGKIPDKIEILENGIKFLVDISGGQKTGFFLDQRDKRAALQKYCAGKKVLNCFSYTGGFSVYALAADADKVVSVDVSQPALDLAKENVKANKLDLKKCEFVCEDVKKYLTDCLGDNNSVILSPKGVNSAKDLRRNIPFDIIILDPPAFIKDRHKIREGIMGYKKINEMALKLLPAGGILVTASCSQHLSLVDFRHMLSESAGRAGRTVQILETYTHGIDHPELAAFTEGEYLKCIFALVS